MPDLTWVAPDGSAHQLAVTFVNERGTAGRWAPPVTYSEDAVAGLDGTRLRHIRMQPREVAVPLLLQGDYQAGMRTWMARFDPRRGDGKLRDGERELVCRYVGGAEQAADSVPSVRRFVAVFRAFDPLWRDVDPTVELVDIAAQSFLSADDTAPWFPWQLVSSSAVGGFTVDNNGDDDTWPVWTVQGPGAGLLRLVNDTTGEHIEIADVALAAGEQLHIDTRPGAKTVTGPDGSSLWPDLSDDSILWPIVRGSQTVTVELEGAEAGSSNVRLEYRRRWLTA